MMQCREQSIALHEPYGIWGGLSEDERFAIIERARDRKVVGMGRASETVEAFPSAS